MTEKEIQLLGFEKQVEEGTHCKDFDGNEWFEDGFHYYTYDITNGLTLISSSSDAIDEDGWYVEIFNTEDPIRFFKFEEVQSLINLLQKCLIKE
jgi:hypothetical protein